MGIAEDNIIYINFESFEFSDIDKAEKLYTFVKSKITNKQRYYVLLDEIQEVESWEKKTQEKYFAGDQSLLYAIMGFKDRLISGVLKNIVMLELKRRGYRVFVGKLDDKEIDSIAEKSGEKVYI